MRSQDWLILKHLYATKNITKAAQRLYISQPAFSSRLKQLEKEFGIKIVTRERRGVNFTPQGEYLAKSAEEMLLKIQEIKENIANMDREVVGTIKFGVSNFFTKYKLPRLLKLFKDRYPNVDFQVTTGWSRDMFHALYNKDVHIAFVRGDYPWLGRKQLLFEEQLCIASAKELDIADLPNLPRIDYKTDSLLKSLIEEWWTKTYLKPPFITMEVDQVDTCKEMVANGLGYAIMPSMILNGMEDIYKISLTDKEGEALLRKTWMLYHDESLELNVIKVFVAFIEDLDTQDMNGKIYEER
ncbi:LysR family transcriptional regulator [Oceanobacillus profundus]|uniref:LysR family transcriptional regulator n=1 Tax=Oceanobacillus profundus TaxID=372463 RepID=A0A417YN30_9BACI|nr:LysR family transcriptional regulator [Oceanobacillus profundus]RHW35109.1 LysR family transcriptional regulator [Oceanobacillus profundus]